MKELWEGREGEGTAGDWSFIVVVWAFGVGMMPASLGVEGRDAGKRK